MILGTTQNCQNCAKSKLEVDINCVKIAMVSEIIYLGFVLDLFVCMSIIYIKKLVKRLVSLVEYQKVVFL